MSLLLSTAPGSESRTGESGCERSGGFGGGLIKGHAKIDIETDQITGLEVTDESVQDDPLFTPLLDQASENCGRERPIRQFFGDGGYDRIHVFNHYRETGIKSGVKTRENAASRSTGSAYRAECVRERNKSGGYRERSDMTRCGMRRKSGSILRSQMDFW
mgnify:CR=1 FL=1